MVYRQARSAWRTCDFEKRQRTHSRKSTRRHRDCRVRARTTPPADRGACSRRYSVDRTGFGSSSEPVLFLRRALLLPATATLINLSTIKRAELEDQEDPTCSRNANGRLSATNSSQRALRTSESCFHCQVQRDLHRFTKENTEKGAARMQNGPRSRNCSSRRVDCELLRDAEQRPCEQHVLCKIN